MPTTTTNYGLLKPIVNSATDEDKFGGQINSDIDYIDAMLLTGINFVTSAKTAAFSVTAPTTGSATLGDSNKLFVCDATSGTIVASLPAAASAGAGFTVAFKKTDTSTNAITITPNGTEKIDGAATYSLSTQYKYVVLVSDASTWHVISDNSAGEYSLAANGYQVMPSGLIIQWGVTSSILSGASTTVTFPKAFTSALYSVTASLTGGPATTILAASICSSSTTQVVIGNCSSGTQIAYWQAFGK